MVCLIITSSDEQFFAENQVKDVQDEQELLGQCTHHNEIISSFGEATDGNDDPSKDPDHTIDAENTIIDEPYCTLDSMEIKIVGEANDTNGHPSQESDVTVNVKNSNVDELDIIYDRYKTIDTIAEQTESTVDDDFDHNDVSKKELPVQCIHASEEVNTVDKVIVVNSVCRYDSDANTVSEANDVHGHSSQEIGVQIDRENSKWMNLTFMTVPKQMMEMLIRQNQLLMMMLKKMMYPKILFKAYKTKL